MRALAALAGLAACSFPAKHPSTGDAPAADASPFGCAGQPFQTTAPPKLAISGDAADLGTGVPGANVTVQGVLDSGGVVFTATTAATGKFATVVDTAGNALVAHIVTTQGTYVPSYYYPAHPFDADSDIPLPMLMQAELAQVGNPSGTALGELIIGDCLGIGLAGCTLQIQPPPTLLEYAKNGMPSMTASSTDSTGYVIAYGIPVGVSSFAAICPTGPLRAKSIAMAGDSTYFIRLEP